MIIVVVHPFNTASSIEQDEKEEAVLALHSSLLKYKIFWELIDCRPYSDLVISVTIYCAAIAHNRLQSPPCQNNILYLRLIL